MKVLTEILHPPKGCKQLLLTDEQHDNLTFAVEYAMRFSGTNGGHSIEDSNDLLGFLKSLNHTKH